MTQIAALRSHADQALAVYLEPHADRRRVLLLGEAEGTLAARLQEVADRVDIIDPGSRAPSRGQVPELPFDDASFDLVVVADVLSLPEPTQDAVRELKRVLADAGALVLCTYARAPKRSRAGSPQSALDRLLRGAFRHVDVLAQAPLAGYSLAALLQGGETAREEEFSVDSSLVRGIAERNERFIGIASDVRQQLESRLWIQVPLAEPAEAEAEPPAQDLSRALRRAEDEAREALHRETDLLRQLEGERRARAQAEQLGERAKVLERRLLASEGDYDDAVARVRFLENESSEREAALEQDRVRRDKGEREIQQAKAEASAAQAKLATLEREREAVRAEIDGLGQEAVELEKRLVEAGQKVLELKREKKHHEVVARDLLEELRRLEHDKTAAVEHDARVAELEAERERAVQRALEAEVARESAQMRVDELRAQLGRTPARPEPRPDLLEEREAARGEITGLRLRLSEAESALAILQATSEAPREIQREDLETSGDGERIAELEAEIERLTPRALEAARAVELEAELDSMEHRIRALTRELEEADRYAEAHAEDADRFDALDAELDTARRRLDALEDELRAGQDELRAARIDAQSASVEASTRLELAQRREQEARGERDDARVALGEARGILAQLANRVGADAENPPSIVEAFASRDQRRDDDGALELLRSALADREQRLSEISRELEARDQRIRQLEFNLQASIRGSVPPPFGGSEGPETD